MAAFRSVDRERGTEIRTSRFFLLLSLLLALTVPTTVSEARTVADDNVSQQALDPTQLERLLDPFFAAQLDALHVPGAVVVVVGDGGVIFAKGYGYASLEQRLPFDPGETIVRAGSTVKVLTAMAVMQLAEQGAVDVYADVNRYLTSFQIPDTFPEPITLHQLLHHTAGLDHNFIGVRAYSEEDLIPLATFLSENLPPRVYPPGRLRHYTDYHIALAGLVVEEVAGMSFADYVRKNIFTPLGMDSSFMLVPDEQLHRMATSYTYQDGRYRTILEGNYYLHTAPGGTWNSTALDVARFMLVHLQGGRYGEARVLRPETVAEMHRRQFSHDPALPGMAYAFDEHFMNGHRLLAKSGAVPGMQSHITLLPEEDVGWFVAYNRYGGALQRSLNELLMNTYFLEEEANVLDPVVPVAPAQLHRYTGRYRELIGYASGSFEKVSTLINQVQVTANGEGGLELFGDAWQPVGPGRFQRENGDYAVFDAGDGGPVTAFYYQRTSYLRVPWYEAMPLQFGLVGLSVLGSLIALALALSASRANVPGLHMMTALSATTNLAFVIGFGLFMLHALGSGEPPWDLLYGPLPILLLLLSLPLLALLLTLSLVCTALFRRRSIGAGKPVAALLVLVLSTSALTFFAHTWNLLGFHF